MCVSDYIIKTEIVLKKKKGGKVDIRVHFGNLADLSVYVTGTAGGSERHRQ